MSSHNTVAGLAITRIASQRRSTDRVNVFVEGEFCCGAAYEVLVAEKLRVGSVLREDQLERLIAADAKWKAKQAALSLLGVRARARGELAERLRRKGHQGPATEYALAEAERLGLLDDCAFAESWVRDRIRLKPRGSAGLVAELTSKRVATDVAREAVDRVMRGEDVDEGSLCMAAAAKWARARSATPINADDANALKRRLTAFLARRGYAPGHIQTAVRSVLSTV